MIARRPFVLAVGAGACVSPLRSMGQSGARLRRVGVVFNGSAESDRAFREAFLNALLQQSPRDARSIQLEPAYADGRSERLSQLLGDMVARQPDVIVVAGSAASVAARQATSTIPIVMAAVGDPVALGLVASLARPGGNVTGNAMMAEAFVSKALEILHETIPTTGTLGALVDTQMPMAPYILTPLDATARRLGVAIERHEARGPEELDRVLGAFAARRPAALMVLPFPLFLTYSQRIVDSLSRNRIPAILMIEQGAELGGLMGYGVERIDLWRKAAKYVRRILDGARPADLAVELPTKFELVVNLKTADAMSVKVPQSVLLRADRVIH